jgi:hypothetical protein
MDSSVFGLSDERKIVIFLILNQKNYAMMSCFGFSPSFVLVFFAAGFFFRSFSDTLFSAIS